MRIVAHNGARIWGGAERATVMLLRGLRGRGHDVQLLCNDDLVLENALARNIPVRKFVLGGDVALPHAVSLARELRRAAPDVFIIGTFKKLFLASLAGRLARVPRVVARVGLESDTPRSAKYRFALRQWVDGVAVNAGAMSESFAGLDGFGPGKVAVIHNGVVAPHGGRIGNSLREELGIAPDVFVVGTAARLARQKRIDRLLLAVHDAPQGTHCIVAGDGEERDDLERLAADLGLKGRVHFLGHRENMAKVLDAIDVFVVASDREGLSNAMLEAMSVGLPVVSTPVSGAAEALAAAGEEPAAGIVTDFTHESIAEAFRTLLADPVRRGALGAAARGRAERQFSFDAMLDKWETFLAPRGAREGTGLTDAYSPLDVIDQRP